MSSLRIEGQGLPGTEMRAVGWHDNSSCVWSVDGARVPNGGRSYTIQDRDCGKTLRVDASANGENTSAEYRIPAAAEPRALYFTENLNGASLGAGKTITVGGWYVEKDPSGCQVTWMSNGEVIPGANSTSYTLQEIDIPSQSNPQQRVIRCEAVYKAEKKGSCELLIPGWQAPAAPPAERAIPIDLLKLEVLGGPFHLDPIKVVATYSDGLYHAGQCQWFRKEGRIDDYQPLKGQTEEIYYPTADDLHGNLFVQYTVLVGEKKNMVAKGSVRESFLVIHPDVQSAVESNIKKGSASFDVTDEKGQKRGIYIDKKKVKLTNPADPSTDSKVQHSGIVRCEIQKDATSFRLILGPRAKTDPEILRAVDRKERDIIALTIRSFIGHTVQNVEQVKAKKLHTTHSLTELGHFVEYVNPAPASSSGNTTN